MPQAKGKDLLLSTTFIGAILVIVANLLSALGYPSFDPDAALGLVMDVIGGILVIFGRIKATKEITSVFGIDISSLRAWFKSPFAWLLVPLLCVQCAAAQGHARLASVNAARATRSRIDDAPRPRRSYTWGEFAKLRQDTTPAGMGGAIGTVECPDPRLAIDLPPDVRYYYRNPDGSCVQCSIGMCGADQNVDNAAMILWDSEYGGAERGGSGSSRVSNYAHKRGLRIWNVTGKQTYDWMKWACSTGRGCAIGAGGSHFQTLVGHDPKTNTWWVCNNNSAKRIDEYDDASFHRLHEASGNWIVVLDYPPHPSRPRYVKWWE